MMVRESSGSGAGVIETATVAVLETTLPSEFVNTAVTVLLPVASPVALTETTDGRLEFHLIWVELVTSCWRPVLPEVPSAMNWPV
jgi:hypothetical protein